MDEMERQLTQSFTLRMRDCDAHGRWKRSSLLKEMQELGEDHSSVLGFSRAQLIGHGMCWVLYRLAFALYQEPMMGEELAMTTWPGPIEGPLFPRYYAWQRGGALIGEAATTWALFDIQKRRVLRPSMLPGDYAPCLRPSGLHLPGALSIGDMPLVETRRVRYTDLDANGHMNNARYADWISDLLEGKDIRRLQINYVAEARLGDQVALHLDANGMIAGLRQDGRTIFQAQAALAE
ncbi:MAG TPA: hypothetical protein IAA74_08650 [Candidatus Excrementavichristensenella intestinipullorum]|nr:hypothetical protein [Candidatus Excrementavichristensenella intestinipullorum]